MGRILSSIEVDGSIPIEFNRSQNFTSRIEILCCLTAREATWVSKTTSMMAKSVL